MTRPDHDDQPSQQTRPGAPAQPALSSREWLARGREQPIPPMPALRPEAPSRRFTWGVRAGIVLAALFYGALMIWTRSTAEHPMSTLAAALFGLALLLAAAALVEAWCWARRPRFSPSQSEAITADLYSEDKKTVRRMARGRGPEVPELRPRAAASAQVQRQNNSAIALAAVSLGTLGTLGQSSGGVVGLVLGGVVLLIAGAGLADALWMGHRARLLRGALDTDAESPAPTP